MNMRPLFSLEGRLNGLTCACPGTVARDVRDRLNEILKTQLFTHIQRDAWCGLHWQQEGGRAPFGSGASPGLGVEADSAGSGSVGCQDSNSVRAMPLCRMIERSVPMASSEWSGTGTVTVPASVLCCITT